MYFQEKRPAVILNLKPVIIGPLPLLIRELVIRDFFFSDTEGRQTKQHRRIKDSVKKNFKNNKLINIRPAPAADPVPVIN